MSRNEIIDTMVVGMKKIFILGFGALVIFGAWFYLKHPLGQKVILNGHTFYVEVAVTPADKEKGLGARNSIAPDHGMLFIYQNKDRYGYWMKGMRFPLDYIWLDGNRIVDLTPDVPAPATPTEAPVELAPKSPVDKVLEVNAGVIAQTGIKVGDIVQFQN